MRLLPLLLCLPLATFAAEPATEPTPAPATTTPAAAPVPEAKPFLGLRFDETAPNFATEPGIPVSEVVAGATAQTLGVEVGDRLLSINGKAIKGIADLQAILGGSKVGDTVTVSLDRNGSTLNLTGPLAAKPKPVQVSNELASAQKSLEEVRRLAASKAREPSLAELLQQLQDIQAGLPRAVAAFKKQYPNGTFDIRLSVTISSDATAKDPIEFTNVGKDAPKQDAPKQDAAKPEAPKADTPKKDTPKKDTPKPDAK
jgi:membrane-associated protease RseP (regulator of RpoE activity)